MKHIVFATCAAMCVLMLAILIAIGMTQERQHVELRNGYYPFSVETSVRDR